jgi:hypothetical protein
MYIPSKLFVRGNAAATANNIAAHETVVSENLIRSTSPRINNMQAGLLWLDCLQDKACSIVT